MAAFHILIFGEMVGCKIVGYKATHVKKALKVCNIKVCNMKKYCILSSNANYMGKISKYIIEETTICFLHHASTLYRFFLSQLLCVYRLLLCIHIELLIYSG